MGPRDRLRRGAGPVTRDRRGPGCRGGGRRRAGRRRRRRDGDDTGASPPGVRRRGPVHRRPGLDPHVTAASLEAGMAHLPGVATATEIQQPVPDATGSRRSRRRCSPRRGWPRGNAHPVPGAAAVERGHQGRRLGALDTSSALNGGLRRITSCATVTRPARRRGRG